MSGVKEINSVSWNIFCFFKIIPRSFPRHHDCLAWSVHEKTGCAANSTPGNLFTASLALIQTENNDKSWCLSLLRNKPLSPCLPQN